jgi:PKHD-type hydroxylase
MNLKNVFTQPEVDPQNYYWFDKGFSSEELEKVSREVELLPFKEATTFASTKKQNVVKQIRSSSIKWVPQNNNWSWLYDKLMEQSVEANKVLWNFNLISANELIQYTEYYDVAGGHYTWHQDIGPGMASLRKVSITVQLSDADDYEGGNLEIWSGGESVKIAPRGRGNVVIFPSYMMHRVTPVTKGTRKSFVLWVGGEHYR